MISHISHFLVFLLLSSIVSANNIEYKADGKYRVLSNKHLINDISYKNKNTYQALIEIPTGSRQKWEVNHKSGYLEWEFKNSIPRKVKFLPYPGNYGFIPQTLSGDGDALDIIVLSENVERGAILQIKIIGMLKLLDHGEEDNKVIAITNSSAFEGIDTLNEMLLKKPHVLQIIKLWFEAYKGPNSIMFMGYEDQKKTLKHIENSHINWMKKKF